MTNKEVKVNPNFTPPAERAKAIRKCPYRKVYTIVEEPKWSKKTITEDFQICIEKECALWTPLGCKG